MNLSTIDQRPKVLKTIGVLLIFTTSLPGVLGFVRSSADTLERVQLEYQRRTGQELTLFNYVGQCSRDPRCLDVYVRSWRASPLERGWYVGGFAFGVAVFITGVLWKPEVMAQRTARMRAWRQVDVARSSSAKPSL
jgi:hypothetical protein